MLLKKVSCVYGAEPITFSNNPFKVFFCKMKHLNPKQKERLEKVSKKEWQEAINQVKSLIDWRLYGSKANGSGAHSEMALGMPAADHYVGEAV